MSIKLRAEGNFGEFILRSNSVLVPSQTKSDGLQLLFLFGIIVTLLSYFNELKFLLVDTLAESFHFRSRVLCHLSHVERRGSCNWQHRAPKGSSRMTVEYSAPSHCPLNPKYHVSSFFPSSLPSSFFPSFWEVPGLFCMLVMLPGIKKSHRI